MHEKRSKASCVLASFALVSCAAFACGHETDVVTRTVTTHVPASCAPDAAASPYGYFLASGDFDPSIGVQHSLKDVGAELPGVPASTRSVVVDVSAGDGDWRGVGDVASAGGVDVLVWPFSSACALSTIDAANGVALAMIGPSRAIAVGGVGRTSVPHEWLVDLATGAVAPMKDGLLTPRSQATVTRFGGGALVAGGFASVDPAPLATAEVFVPSLHGTGGFDHQTIPMSGVRYDHGAIELATGETLLVGGLGSGDAPLRSFELIDPVTRASHAGGLAQLEVARFHPTVLRLANGEILVAGGFDGQKNPVTKLEWFTADATRVARNSRDLVARPMRAFVALPGGGALAVIAPGPMDTAFSSVWVISADGDPEAATPITGSLTSVALFPGGDGRPLLWAGDRWLRWSPWDGAFGATEIPPPDCAAKSIACPIAATPIASPDSGLALFLGGDGASVTGLRFAARSAYGSLVEPLLVSDTSFLAPDRLVLPGTTTSYAFDAQRGLTLSLGASAFVTDLTFASFALDADTPTGEPPTVVLRDDAGEIEIGAATCPFGAVQSIHVERSGASIRVGSRDCTVTLRADARLSIGLRGGADGDKSVVRNVRIARR